MSENLKLAFKGAEYVVPASKIFVIGEEIERHVPFSDLQQWSVKGPPVFLLARLYAQMLRHGGAKVTDWEVRQEMMATLSNPDGESQLATVVRAVADISRLLMMGAPEGAVGDAQPGKPSAS